MKNIGEEMRNKIRNIIKHYCRKEIEQIKKIETGHFNDTYLITLQEKVLKMERREVNSNQLILRIAPPDEAGFLFYEQNMMKQEPKIHKIVHDLTQIPLPRIYVFDENRKFIDRNFLLMEKLEGTALSRAYWIDFEKRKKILEEVGENLQEVHSIHAKRYGYLGPHHPMSPQSSWWAAFSVMWRKIIQGVYNCGFYKDKEKDHYIALLEKKKGHFDARKHIPSSLLHMDIWGQNILVNEKGIITGIVDWDRALWGDPEIEFAVLDYCGISEPSFWDGYGGHRETDESSKIRDLFYLLYEHQKYIPINYLRRNDRHRAQRYATECKQLFSKLRQM